VERREARDDIWFIGRFNGDFDLNGDIHSSIDIWHQTLRLHIASLAAKELSLAPSKLIYLPNRRVRTHHAEDHRRRNAVARMLCAQFNSNSSDRLCG
jgi:hypothetical protein